MIAPMPASLGARRVGGADVAMLALIGALTVLSLAVVFDPRVAPAVVDPELDAVFSAISTIVAAALTALFWVRYREGDAVAALVRASAFAVLLVANLPRLIVTLADATPLLGMSLDEPGQLPVLIGIIGRTLAAALLVLAGAVAMRHDIPRPPRPAALVVGPALLAVAVIGVAVVVQDRLPPLLTEEGLTQLRERPVQALVGPALSPGVMVIQLLAAAGYLLAAAYSWRLFHQDGRGSEALLAAGLVLAAFGQVHFAIHPGAYAGLVTVGDTLRVAFYGVLLFAVIAESREDVRDLRVAHADLRRLRDAELSLRDAELTSVAMEERARLAREIHDGLAQDLWYAKLKQGRLATLLADAGVAEPRQLAGEVATAIDSALVETRQAVMALRPQLEGGPLDEVLARYVEDFSDRFAVRAVFNATGPIPPLAPRAQAEVLRIVQEALNNARKHADATLLRVDASATNGIVRFEVADNGRGFDVSAVPGDRYGLTSMRERAELIGGSLEVTSEPQNGTRVAVVVPIEGEGR
jgi:signal transduction histidine kinase